MGSVIAEVQEPLARLLAAQPEAPLIVSPSAALVKFDLQ